MMKKLLFVIPTLRMGGAEKALMSLLKCLDPAQVSVDLFLFEHGGILQSEIPAWVQLLPEDPVTRGMTLEFRYYWKDLLRRGKLRAAWRRLWMKLSSDLRQRLRKPRTFEWHRVAPVIAPLPGSYDVAIGFLEGFADFYVIDKTTAAKKIGWVHTDFKNRTLLSEEKEYYGQFDAIATITEACEQSLLQVLGLPAEKLFVIENITIPDEVLRLAEESGPDWSDGRYHLLTVARLEHQKGMDLAFSACRLLRQANAPVCWHVLGDGSMKQELESEIRAEGLEQQFQLEGVTANPYPYMKAAWAIVQPSRVEGKSIVLDEAKILKKRIITTNYPSVTDQLTDGVNGIVTEMTPQAISQAVLRLLEDGELAAQLTKCWDTAEDPSLRPREAFSRLIGLS